MALGMELVHNVILNLLERRLLRSLRGKFANSVHDESITFFVQWQHSFQRGFHNCVVLWLSLLSNANDALRFGVHNHKPSFAPLAPIALLDLVLQLLILFSASRFPLAAD